MATTATKVATLKGTKGDTGTAGRSISSAAINGSGRLILTLSDASTIDAGSVVSAGSGSSAAAGTVKGLYSSTSPYAVGDVVSYQGQLYQFTQAITPGSFTNDLTTAAKLSQFVRRIGSGPGSFSASGVVLGESAAYSYTPNTGVTSPNGYSVSARVRRTGTTGVSIMFLGAVPASFNGSAPLIQPAGSATVLYVRTDGLNWDVIRNSGTASTTIATGTFSPSAVNSTIDFTLSVNSSGVMTVTASVAGATAATLATVTLPTLDYGTGGISYGIASTGGTQDTWTNFVGTPGPAATFPTSAVTPLLFGLPSAATAAGQVLRANSTSPGDVSWATVPSVTGMVGGSFPLTATSVPTNTWTAIPPASADAATSGVSYTGTQVKVTVAGWYQVSLIGEWAPVTGASRRVAVWKNGASSTVFGGDESTSGFNNHQTTVSGALYLVPGDYVEARTWQNTGSAVTFQYATLMVTLASTAPVSATGGAWTTASMSIPTGVWTALPLSSPDANNLGPTWSSSSNPSRVTAVTAGWYNVAASGPWGPTTGGSRRYGIWKNGATINILGGDENVGGLPYPAAAGSVYLNVGDYVELYAWQDTGSAQTHPATTRFSVTLSSTSASGPTVTAWTNVPTPANGTASGAQYRINGDNVELRGYITGLTTAAGTGLLLFTLPAGFRPPATQGFPGLISTNNSLGNVSVGADGTVTLYTAAAQSGVSLSLSGIRFSTAA